MSKSHPQLPSSEARLKDLLRHARENVPYYRDLAAPSDDADPFEVLASVSPLSRGEVHRTPRSFVTLREEREPWGVAKTTGTSGEPLSVTLDAEAQAEEWRQIERLVRERVEIDPETPYVHLTVQPNSASRPLSRLPGGGPSSKWNLFNLWALDDAAFRSRLSCLDGAVVAAMPSTVKALLYRLGSDLPKPRLLLLSGEEIAPELYEDAQKRFGCAVVGAYATTEAGVVATRCPGCGDYHPSGTAIVEVLNPENDPDTPDEDGEIVLTPLVNRAMALLRFRTGDRGRWVEEPCPAEEALPRLRLSRGRVPARVTAVGVEAVHFSKLISTLPVRSMAVERVGPTRWSVDYESDEPFDVRTLAWVRDAILRHAMGPGEVRFRRLPGPTESSAIGKAAPGPDLHEIAGWIRGELEGGAMAQLTGSGIDVRSRSADSDLDLAILVSSHLDVPRFLVGAQALRLAMPRLSVHIDRADGLASRAPLVACRLLAECLPVVGSADEAGVRWPSPEEVRQAARLWIQNELARITDLVSRPLAVSQTPPDAAKGFLKCVLTGLRYEFAQRGRFDTGMESVLARGEAEGYALIGETSIRDLADWAREFVPPRPLDERGLALAVHALLLRLLVQWES